MTNPTVGHLCDGACVTTQNASSVEHAVVTHAEHNHDLAAAAEVWLYKLCSRSVEIKRL